MRDAAGRRRRRRLRGPGDDRDLHGDASTATAPSSAAWSSGEGARGERFAARGAGGRCHDRPLRWSRAAVEPVGLAGTVRHRRRCIPVPPLNATADGNGALPPWQQWTATSSTSTASGSSPSSTATIEVISPLTEEVIATVPEASNDDVDRAVAAARAAFDSGPWPRMCAGRARRRDGEDLAAHPGALRGRRPHDHRGDGLADLLLGHGPGVRVDDGARLLHGPRPRVPVRGVPRRARSGRCSCAREPVGVVGAHRAVERPAVHDHAEARARARVGFHRRAEARAGDAARRVPARRRARGGRAAGGRGQHRGRRAARSASTSSRTPTSTRSASPAPPRRASGSARSAASSSSAARSSSAASRRRSSSTTPTSPPRSRACCRTRS